MTIEKFDGWQQEIIDYKGPLTVRAGRQVGKSAAVSKRIAEQMFNYPKSITLTIAPSQRQSSQLFIKTMGWLQEAHQAAIETAGGRVRGAVIGGARFPLQRGN